MKWFIHANKHMLGFQAVYLGVCFLCSWHPYHKVVWCRRRLQRDGDGVARPQSGGSLQFLLQEVQPEDCPPVG